jgi:hypothetical protein
VSLRLESVEDAFGADEAMERLHEVAGLDMDVLDETTEDGFDDEDGGS